MHENFDLKKVTDVLENVEVVEEMLSVLRQCKPWESDTVLMLSIIAAIQMMAIKGTNTNKGA